MLVVEQEKIAVKDGLPLRLSFSPQAIREHFGDSPAVQALSNEKLASVAESILSGDELYAVFHRLLVEALVSAGLTEDQIGG